jgi:hypothetical protein
MEVRGQFHILAASPLEISFWYPLNYWGSSRNCESQESNLSLQLSASDSAELFRLCFDLMFT